MVLGFNGVGGINYDDIKFTEIGEIGKERSRERGGLRKK